MSERDQRAASTWFQQARSDERTARALNARPAPMEAGDVVCHVLALCAQTVEKSLKGYVLLNHHQPKQNHRPDKYLANLLTKGDPLLRHTEHFPHLSKLFDVKTKRRIKELFDLTPGGAGNGNTFPNTEYPWKVGGEWARTPYGTAFCSTTQLADYLDVAKRILDMFEKLKSSSARGP